MDGYLGIGVNRDVFVSDEDAYAYAFERCTNGTEEEINEFKEMLVEWFFSGNWVRKSKYEEFKNILGVEE